MRMMEKALWTSFNLQPTIECHPVSHQIWFGHILISLTKIFDIIIHVVAIMLRFTENFQYTCTYCASSFLIDFPITPIYDGQGRYGPHLQFTAHY